MNQGQILNASCVLFYSVLIATYSVAHVRDVDVRKNDAGQEDYVSGISATVIGGHVIGGLTVFMYYNKKHISTLLVSWVLLMTAFFFNLKLLEIPKPLKMEIHNDSGETHREKSVDWLSEYYPVVWRLSSFFISLVYYFLIYTVFVN